MFNGVKSFFFDDIRTKILDKHTKENILNIVDSMLKLTMPEKEAHEDLLPKISIIVNEVLTNIFKYEEKPIFKIIFKIEGYHLIFSVLINGKTLDINKIFKHIKFLSEQEKKDDLLFLNGLGLYNCYKISDNFEIKKIKDDSYFEREISCHFNLLTRGVFL